MEVRVGERVVPVAPFNGRKVILAGRAVRSITEVVPNVVERVGKFSRDYAAANATVVTRDMALAIPAWRDELQHVSDVQWEAAGGELRIPSPPSFEEQLAAIFPTVFEAAEEHVLRLLALTVVANEALAQAARDGKVDELLEEEGQKLLDDGTIPQLIELAALSAETIKGELEAARDPLGKLRALVRRALGTEEDKPEESAAFAAAKEETKPSTPDSSTSSDERTDGTPTSSSTEPRGASSVGSVT